jgi:hypothetical protein
LPVLSILNWALKIKGHKYILEKKVGFGELSPDFVLGNDQLDAL